MHDDSLSSCDNNGWENKEYENLHDLDMISISSNDDEIRYLIDVLAQMAIDIPRVVQGCG